MHPEGVRLNSYYSEQEAKVANIVIRRQHLRGAYGDIGFARQPDGQLAMIKDELDEHRGYGARWIGRVQQLYKEKQTCRLQHQEVPSFTESSFTAPSCDVDFLTCGGRKSRSAHRRWGKTTS